MQGSERTDSDFDWRAWHAAQTANDLKKLNKYWRHVQETLDVLIEGVTYWKVNANAMDETRARKVSKLLKAAGRIKQHYTIPVPQPATRPKKFDAPEAAGSKAFLRMFSAPSDKTKAEGRP